MAPTATLLNNVVDAAITPTLMNIAARATYSLDYMEYDYLERLKTRLLSLAILLGIVLGVWLIAGLFVGIVWYVRERKRKAWYGPTAQYYRERGFGRSGMVGYGGGGTYVPQVVYVPYNGGPQSPAGVTPFYNQGQGAGVGPQPGPVPGSIPGSAPAAPALVTHGQYRPYGPYEPYGPQGERVSVNLPTAPGAAYHPNHSTTDFTNADNPTNPNPFGSPYMAPQESHGVTETTQTQTQTQMRERKESSTNRLTGNTLSLYSIPVDNHNANANSNANSNAYASTSTNAYGAPGGTSSSAGPSTFHAI